MRKRRSKPKNPNRLHGAESLSPVEADVDAPDDESLMGRIRQFTLSRTYKNPQRTIEVLRVGMANVHSMECLLRGDFVQFVTTEVYLHYDGGGFGPVRTLKLLEAFLCWLEQEGVLMSWDLARLLHCVDDARESHSLPRRHPLANERCVCRDAAREDPFTPSIGSLSQEMAADLDSPMFERPEAVESLLGLIASLCETPGGLVRFGVLVPEHLASALRAAQAERSDVDDFNVYVLKFAVATYQWLGRRHYLQLERAEQLQRRLVALAGSFSVASDLVH